MMKKLCSLAFLLLLVSRMSFAQEEAEFIEDINGDGVSDILKTWYDGGSGFGGYYGEVINGATGKVYELNTWGCFCQMSTVIPFPPEASLDEHSPFYEALASKLFPDVLSDPDPTLDWVIQANLLAIVPEEDETFDLILPVRLTWNQGQIQKPSKYQIKADDQKIKSMYYPIHEPAAWIDDSNQGYLVYYGNNHDLNLEEIAQGDGDQTIWKGKHSLILKDGDREAVVFITDGPLTSGPVRLRDPSISSIISNGGHAFFTVSESPESSYRIFLIDLNSGTVARLKESLSGYGRKISIEENNLFNQEGQVVVEDVSKIIESLIEKAL